MDKITAATINAKARKASADARKLEAKNEKRRIDLEAKKEENKNKFRKQIKIAFVTLFIALIGFIAFYFYSNQKASEEQKAIAEQQQQQQQAELERDYKSGAKCIPVDKLEEYLGNNVCIEFNVTYINSNDYFIYLDNQKGGNTQAAIPQNKKILTTEEATEKYLYKTIRVRGELEKYQDSYEIIVSDLNQIEIISE